jgi:hypothetical protein
METRRVRCEVRRGVFDSEYIVSLPALLRGQKRNIEFVSDSSGVTILCAQPAEDSVPGTIEVWYLGPNGDCDRVLVPGSGGSDSAIVDVPRDAILV